MQSSVKNFLDKYRLSNDIKIRYMDLVSEIGELGKEIIKTTDYGKKDVESTPFIKDEVGDCFFSLLTLCCVLDVNAEDALQGSLEKYQTRFLKKGDIGS